ncbi:MAG: GTPase [Herbaspirillum sp.]
MLETSLVVGSTAAARETSLVNIIDSTVSNVIVLEGLPGGQQDFAQLIGSSQIQIIRIAPGCPCCSGNLILRVTLNRILRHPPQNLYLSLASNQHLTALRTFLSHPPYDELLHLNQDIIAESNL